MFKLELSKENTIRITFPYSPEAVETIKKFSIRNWNQEGKYWEIPLRIANEIPQILGIEIPLNIREQYEHIYVPKIVKFDPSILNSGIIPYPFQISGIEFLSSYKNALLSDEVGLGKTLQAIATALMLKCNKILVICPASVKKQWCREISKFTNKSCIVIEGNQKQRYEQYSKNVTFYITNYELILKDINTINIRNWDMVIADEISRIKNWKSKTKNSLLRIKTNFKLGISATPIENNIQELHSILSWICPDLLGTYWNFVNEYCYFCQNSFGGYTITGIKNPKLLHDKLKTVMIRRKKLEVFTELPSIVHNEYYVPLSTTQNKMYNEIKSNIMNLVQKEEMDDRVLNEIMYLRELCNSPRLLNPDLLENGKVPEIIEIIKQFSAEHKIVIFSQWIKFLNLLKDELIKENINFVQIQGDISQDMRDENINKFNTDTNIRILLSSDAGNMGLNLQIADVLIHCDLLWNPQRMLQREGRVHRIGQTKTVNVITVMTENTIEEKVYAMLKEKSELFNQIIEDTEKIKYDKDIIRRIFK